MSKTNIMRRIILAVTLCAAVVVTSTTTNFPKQLTKQADAALTLTDLAFDPMAILAGEKHMCYRDMGNGLLCAGDNTVGQLGQGNNTALLYAKSIKTSHLPSPANLNDMVGGKNHNCFIRTTGTPANAVYCFGDNTYGQLGDGTNTSSNQAVLVADNVAAGFTNTGVARVMAGGNSTCAVSSTWRLFCWGRNDQGQLGNGNTTDSNIPVAVGAPFNVDSSVMSSGGMAIGGSHACATSFTGSYALYCWGDNAFGQIGDGTTVDKTSPTQLTIVNTQGRTSVAASESTTCAVGNPNRTLKCWGLNNKGQVGDGSTTNRSNPTTVSNANGFANGTNGGVSVFGGGHTMCGHVDTTLYCWGDNSFGQVPGNQTTSLTTVTPIPASGSFTNNASLGNTAIGVSQSTTSSFICYGRWCWGDNDFGQLSQNTQTDLATPAKIKSGSVSADSVAAPTIVSATFGTRKIIIKISGLLAGARISIMPVVPEVDPNSMNQMVVGNTETPTITNGEATVELSAYSVITPPNFMSPANYTVDTSKTYKVKVSQSANAGVNPSYPDGFTSMFSSLVDVTGGTTSSSGSTPTNATPTTTVPKAATGTTSVIPGVTVTDTKVYVAAPAKVASASAIDVLTPAQAKTSDIVSKTPSVCLPNDEDLVFIDEGRCIAEVVNQKTRKVLRTLKTTVVADEVSELNVGNEIAVLSPLYFTAGTSTLKASSIRRLNSLIPQVKAAGSILVAGHSGVLMGDTAENRALSRQRANTVVAALKKRGATADFAIAAVGALDPVSTANTQSAQDKNRRAVIVLIP